VPGTLRVSLQSTLVGTFTNIPGDYNIFAFAPEYFEDPDRPVLSQSFIDANGELIRRIPRTHTIAPPFFANLLPESGSLLRTLVARQRGLKSGPDYPFLRVLGRDLPGAVVVEEPDAPEEPAGDADAPETGTATIRFSLAGMQLKFSARGAWIVKLPTNAYSRLPENEFAVMTLAAAVGLNVPEVQLRELDEFIDAPPDLPVLRPDEPRLMYAIKRFDRLDDGGRVHVEDFNQIAAQQPDQKYENKASSWVANVIATLCEPEDVDEFVRRLTFGICVGNDDMHLKNWALAYVDGHHATIAPAYDFICSRPYFPNGTLALTVGGEREFTRITADVMRSFARQAGISAKRVSVLVREVVERVRAAWPSVKVGIDDRALVAALERHFARVPIMDG
jgi:serine/threonine-protein kinase HipA